MLRIEIKQFIMLRLNVIEINEFLKKIYLNLPLLLVAVRSLIVKRIIVNVFSEETSVASLVSVKIVRMVRKKLTDNNRN